MMWEMGLWAAVAPFGLVLLTAFWQYPAWGEEFVKWGIMHFAADNLQFSMRNGVGVGLIFGLSEAVLYSMNVWTSQRWETMVLRLLLTVPMHTVTGGIIAGTKVKGYGWLGLILAILIHASFNYTVGLTR
jgi:hypothetical protein